MMSPPEKVAAAMPGTLAELSMRTTYPVGEVLRQITNLRREGRRVNAIPEAGIHQRYPIESGVMSTIYALDATSGEE